MDEKKKLDRKKIMEMGHRKREYNRRGQENFRRNLKDRGIATALLRIDSHTMNLARRLAKIRRQSLNEFLSQTVGAEVSVFEQKLSDYASKKIDSKTVKNDIRVSNFAEFVMALVEKKYQLNEEEQKEYDKILAAEKKRQESENAKNKRAEKKSEPGPEVPEK